MNSEYIPSTCTLSILRVADYSTCRCREPEFQPLMIMLSPVLLFLPSALPSCSCKFWAPSKQQVGLRPWHCTLTSISFVHSTTHQGLSVFGLARFTGSISCPYCCWATFLGDVCPCNPNKRISWLNTEHGYPHLNWLKSSPSSTTCIS